MNNVDKSTMHNLMSQLHDIICEVDYKIENEHSNVSRQSQWEALLKRAGEYGYKFLGKGHFAAAFENTGLPGYVIKVGFKKNDSGAAYAAFCRENAGMVGLPVIHLVKRFSRAYMVAMDKYRSLSDAMCDAQGMNGTYEEKVLNISFRVARTIIDDGHEVYATLNWHLEGERVRYIDSKYIKDIAQTSLRVRQFFYGLASFDMHRGNVMVDDKGRLIITDPVSWTARDHQGEMQAKLNAIAE